jgi:hypothetical protein
MLGCVLPAACVASFARDFVGYVKACLLAVLDCTKAAPGKCSAALAFNITASYAKSGQSLRWRSAWWPDRCAPCGFA